MLTIPLGYTVLLLGFVLSSILSNEFPFIFTSMLRNWVFEDMEVN